MREDYNNGREASPDDVGAQPRTPGVPHFTVPGAFPAGHCALCGASHFLLTIRVRRTTNVVVFSLSMVLAQLRSRGG